MSRLKRNLGYQTVYQILSVCLPLITTPYLSRVLGASNLGQFSYIGSITNYFTLFAMLGVTNYGTRTIAESSGDRGKVSRDFWNIFAFQFLTSIIVLGAYLAFVLVFRTEDRLLFLLQGIMIVACVADINWLFFGLEQFRITVTRSIFIRLLTVALIFVLVRSADDLRLYMLIMAGGTLLSNLILWRYAPRMVDMRAVKEISGADIRRHIRPNLVLFVPILAMSVYHVMDKTMLGAISSFAQTGYYYNADKVINIPVVVINGTGTVLMPRMAALAQEGADQEKNSLFHLSMETLFLISTAMAFGIAAVAKEFVPLFFGPGYDPCVGLIYLFAPVLIIKTLSYAARMLYLVPNHKEPIFIRSVFASAVANLGANLLLIPRYGAVGAVLGTMIAELVGCVWQFAGMSKDMHFALALVRQSVYLLLGAAMFAVVRFAAGFLRGDVISLLLEVLLGAVAFVALALAYWKASKSPLLRLAAGSLRKKPDKTTETHADPSPKGE